MHNRNAYRLFHDSFLQIFGKIGSYLLRCTLHGYFCHIGVHHDFYKLLERCLLRIPTQFTFRFRWISPKIYHIGRTVEVRRNLDKYFTGLAVDAFFVFTFTLKTQFDSGITESQLAELTYRMLLAGGNDKIFRLVVLEDQPHALHVILGMEDSAFARSLFKSMGYTDSELKEGKPLIGIANTWNTLVPGHYNLDKVAEYVKNGIYAAGGTAVEFGTIAACDGVAQGHEGMHYILPSREIICDSVEIMAQAHRLDGLVLLASCDKIVPAMLMAAARLDIPCIVCVGGPMLGGIEFDGRKSDLTSISEALGMLKAGKITECEYNSLENTACPGCGSCSFLGTANTMCCVSEALGMTLPGGALIPAAYAGRLRHSFESGRAIVELCKKGITARQILTKEAIRNAIKVTMAICGSTNAVLHLPAIANEAELDMNVLEEFEALTKTTPQIAKVNPAAKPEMEAFYRAGGIPRVMQHLGGLLDTSVMTVSGKTLAENLAGYVYEYPEDPTIIKTVEEPFSKTGGVAVLHGNLCPRTAVSKPGAIDPSMHRFVGKAKCYNSEEEAEEAILGGKIQAGDVVVIRYEGPKGGPGMREMFKAMKYMYGVGLSKSAALITDGRFSGTNNGCFVGHISPEAAEGGPLAIVHDGDEILIDVDEGVLELHVSDEEIAERYKTLELPKKNIPNGYLRLYAKVAASADEGAIIKA